VAALSDTADEVRQTADEIGRGGGEAIAISADVAATDEMQRTVRQTIDRWGRLDIVFANAGINGVWAPLEELMLADWSRTITTNLTGTFLTIKYAVPHLKQHGGSVIVTSSVNGTRIFSNTGATAYATSKAGQVSLVKMLAVELAPHDVRVNVICPGATETQIDQNTRRKDLDAIRFPAEYPQGEIPLGDHMPATGPLPPSRSPSWCSSWPRTPRAISPAPRSGSTAALRSCAGRIIPGGSTDVAHLAACSPQFSRAQALHRRGGHRNVVSQRHASLARRHGEAQEAAVGQSRADDSEGVVDQQHAKPSELAPHERQGREVRLARREEAMQYRPAGDEPAELPRRLANDQRR
jgi:NAD(P)-dependent dehydrogenase (short-subunit alcohol dehydrogenase family)